MRNGSEIADGRRARPQTARPLDWGNPSGSVTAGSVKIPFSYGVDHPGGDPGGTGSPEGGIMDDGQQRPRGAIGAICADAGHKIGADAMQHDPLSRERVLPLARAAHDAAVHTARERRRGSARGCSVL